MNQLPFLVSSELQHEGTAQLPNGKTPNGVLNEVMAASRDYHNQQANPFPVDAFPSELQTIINRLHEQLGLPVDFIAGAILGVASVAAGNTYAVRVNESWVDTGILFIAIVGRPGTAKTPVINLITNPLKELDKESYHDYKQRLDAYRKSQDSAPRPTLYKYIVSDATPEALVQVHECNKRGLLMQHDELAGLFKNFNRYHHGSEQENWLSIWSGQSVTIDRKTSDSVRIARPFISILGGIQPAVLSRMANDVRGDNGVMERFRFRFPNSAKNENWRDSTPDTAAVISRWHSIVRKLTNIPIQVDSYDTPQPTVINYSVGAWQILKEWQKDNAQRINDEDEALAGVLVKMEQHVVRLSLLLQLLSWAAGEGDLTAIDVPAIEGAIKLSTYFTRTAERVRNIISNADPLAELTERDKRYYHELPKGNFTTDMAMEVAKKIPIPERTAKRFMSNKNLFKKEQHGIYSKK